MFPKTESHSFFRSLRLKEQKKAQRNKQESSKKKQKVIDGCPTRTGRGFKMADTTVLVKVLGKSRIKY